MTMSRKKSKINPETDTDKECQKKEPTIVLISETFLGEFDFNEYIYEELVSKILNRVY